MATQKLTRADLIDILKIAHDHLEQYRAYAEAMRAIGRGFYPSSAFQPDYLAGMIRQALAEPQPPAPTTAPVNTAEMTDAQVFAYYKKTALREDLKSYLAQSISDDLRARIETIDKPTKPVVAAIAQAWRGERLQAERAAGRPAIGTEAWFVAEGLRPNAKWTKAA